MYCKNCNAYNDDNSRFCCQCGAQLEKSEGNDYSAPQGAEENGFKDQYSAEPRQDYSSAEQNQSYSRPQYSQPNYGAPMNEPTAPLSNTMAIVSIVINIVVFNVIGLIFAILSLTNYNSYESALRARNYALSEQFKAKSKKYSKVSIILAIVMAVLAFVAGILAFAGVFVIGSRAVESGSYTETFPFDFEDYMMMVRPFVG
ncbi:MAG: zinc ribbon domain-containing protein [Clostridia bacterium]|nr:zinc ribbon domain-containing protein [Clostridia bacterium]